MKEKVIASVHVDMIGDMSSISCAMQGDVVQLSFLIANAIVAMASQRGIPVKHLASIIAEMAVDTSKLEKTVTDDGAIQRAKEAMDHE